MFIICWTLLLLKVHFLTNFKSKIQIVLISENQIVVRQTDDEVYDDGVINEDDTESSVDTNIIEEEISNTENIVKPEVVTVINTDDSNPINRYCKCSSYECNCCRDFSLPLLPIKGTYQFLHDYNYRL